MRWSWCVTVTTRLFVRVLKLAERKGIPVHVIGGPQRKPDRVKRISDPDPPTPRGLPD